MSDDAKLKVVLWAMVIMTIIAVIGAWEFFVRPVVLVVIPFVHDTWFSMMGNLGATLK